ncbi:MAG: RNA repair transcriptional activator RtcR [Myxococcales bacterium]|nr:RNA repair transcriptional activator RtcR [Myxococcales bacterium]
MSAAKPNVVLGLLGTTLDKGRSTKRWQRWRPTVDLARQRGLPIQRLELLYGPGSDALAAFVADDIQQLSSSTKVNLHSLLIHDWWDFENVYSALYDFAESYSFAPETHRYLVHMTTGSHVAQICWFLLVEARIIPGTLLQTAPPKSRNRSQPGQHTTINLNLARYDAIARRFSSRTEEDVSFLKSGIETRNASFNRLIEQLEKVALSSPAPILLLGPTGAGKSQLARRVYELRKRRRRVDGPFVEVNCATLRGDSAMSALFGHEKGAFTGAISSRPGLLRTAHNGVLFLDEIGELGSDEQAMLLRALEEHRFLPVGADQEVESQFSLLAGTNQDLGLRVSQGLFRDDLLARIDTWTFVIPGLSQRPEDIEPNLAFELARIETITGERVSFNHEAQNYFLTFATQAPWPRNFRDFGASLMRMATLAPGGRINKPTVLEEIQRLEDTWSRLSARPLVTATTLPEELGPIDRFDAIQLSDVLKVCAQSSSLSDAGRQLFAESRKKKPNPNDADRLRKYLSRHHLDFSSAQIFGRSLQSRVPGTR